MNETQFAAQYSQALSFRAQLPGANPTERTALLMALSENDYIVRQTIIRDHLGSCPNHFSCGWNDVQDPANPRNEASWATVSRLAMVLAMRESIREELVVPWLPEPTPTPEDLSDTEKFPFYRAR